MSYYKFITFNVVGAVLWVLGFVYGGYWFGNLPIVKANLKWVMVGIIVVSTLPVVVEAIRARLQRSSK